MTAGLWLASRLPLFCYLLPLQLLLVIFVWPSLVEGAGESRHKLAVTVYRCLHGMAPPYLCDGLQRVAELNRRRLRSSMSNALVVPATRLVTVGDSVFPVAGSRLWNSLPTDVTFAATLPVFCSRLKAYLFSVSFLHDSCCLTFTVPVPLQFVLT